MNGFRAFLGRLRGWTLQMLISLDQLGHVWCAGWFYVWLGRGACPNADETISSWVGRRAIAGKGWALIAEKIINAAFLLVGQRDHCRRHIEWGEGAALGRGSTSGRV